MHEIRLANLNDFENIKKLNTKAFADNPKFDEDIVEGYASTSQGEKYFKSAIQSKDGCFFVCEENSVLIGYANGRPMDIDYRKSRYFEIVNIGVDPEKRGLGIGKALLDKVSNWAKKNGFQKIYLNCYAKNLGAIEFYKKNGYEVIDVSLEKR